MRRPPDGCYLAFSVQGSLDSTQISVPAMTAGHHDHLMIACHPGAHFTNDFFHRKWNSMDILVYFHPCCFKVIAIKLYASHESCAALTCAKFCSDMIAVTGVTLRPLVRWITMGNGSRIGPQVAITLYPATESSLCTSFEYRCTCHRCSHLDPPRNDPFNVPMVEQATNNETMGEKAPIVLSANVYKRVH